MKEIINMADKADYGIGSFNVVNMELIMGTIRAAEKTKSPIILQVAEVRLKHAPLDLLGPMMVKAAEEATVPVAVHLDHGVSVATIKQALDLGFTSVMFDGSHLPLEDNIKKTREVVRLAEKYGAAVEGEIGRVGGSEDNSEDIEMLITRTQDAKAFYEATGIDAMAVAIGNAHGVYKNKPNLQFDRLREIDEAVSIPLVLHGGSGITTEDFRKCIACGIKKINVQTATLHSVVDKVRNLFANNQNVDYFVYHNCVIEAAYENVRKHIEAFQSNHKV
jgi:fructose-bisphosphate aldolase class II